MFSAGHRVHVDMLQAFLETHLYKRKSRSAFFNVCRMIDLDVASIFNIGSNLHRTQPPGFKMLRQAENFHALVSASPPCIDTCTTEQIQGMTVWGHTSNALERTQLYDKSPPPAVQLSDRILLSSFHDVAMEPFRARLNYNLVGNINAMILANKAGWGPLAWVLNELGSLQLPPIGDIQHRAIQIEKFQREALNETSRLARGEFAVPKRQGLKRERRAREGPGAR